MSVSRRGRRLVVRLAAGLGVLAAFPFLASGVAQAALAGGNPLTTTNRPDLRTIHVLKANDTATFCFDKTVSNQGFGGGPIVPGKFTLGGYRFDTSVIAVSSNLSSSDQTCVVNTINPKGSYYGGGTRDPTQYSIGSVRRQTVIANAGGSGAPGNIADSTANLDSASHNGTADHTQGPDLQSVGAPDTTNNQLLFVNDQQTESGSGLAADGVGRFLFYDQNGRPHFGYPIGADSLGDVLVQFCTGNGQPAVSAPPGFCNGTDSVSTAVRAAEIRVPDGSVATQSDPASCGPTGCNQEGFPANNRGAVFEKSGDPQTYNPTEAVAVPGTSGTTARPDLISAAIVQASGNPTNQIDYTFNQPITSLTAADFVAVASNGQEITGDSETIIASNTARVTFNTSNLQNFQELLVKASAYPGAVLSVNLVGGVHVINTTGGVAVGGNAGAFATGYTTGPDARSVTFNNTNGSVVVQMDQRVDPNSVNPIITGEWSLLANDGTVVTATPSSAAVVGNSPYQSQVSLTFVPTDLARAVALQISGPPFCGNDSAETYSPGGAPNALIAATTFSGTAANGGGLSAQGTVCQVISPTASGASFHDGKVKARWHHLSKKQLAQAERRARRHRRHRR